MKRTARIVLGSFVCSLLFCGVAAAQTYTPEGKPTYSEAQIAKAIAACVTQIEQAAKTAQQFPMPKFGNFVEPTVTEQLQACIVGNLEGRLLEIEPLG